MRILLLGSEHQAIIKYLLAKGHLVAAYADRLTENSPVIIGVDFIISYGYRHIVKKEVIDKFPDRIINLHISFLPWNKGADPNLWSFLEDTPKGVSIHCLDYGLDTGAIIAQQEVPWQKTDTLRTTYERLSDSIMALFCQCWPDMNDRIRQAARQPPGGSLHRLKDKAAYQHLLTAGWDTPVLAVLGKANK